MSPARVSGLNTGDPYRPLIVEMAVEGLDRRNSFVYGGRRDLLRSLARALPALDLRAEYLRGVAPEYRKLVIIAEAGRRHDVIDRMVLPRIGMIAAEHDLANAHFRG